MYVDLVKRTPVVGRPCTILLYTDTVPAVITRVNRKSITVRAVPVIESSKRRTNHEAEPFPVWEWEGDVSQPLGEPQRFPLVGTYDNGQPRYRSGSIGLRIGEARKRVDYRY